MTESSVAAYAPGSELARPSGGAAGGPTAVVIPHHLFLDGASLLKDNLQMNFEFASAGRIVFGWGARDRVAPAAAAMGRRVLLVTGRRPNPASALAAEMIAAGLECRRFAVNGEPTVTTVEQGVAAAAGTDLIVGLGGGSVLDTAKAVAALAANPGEVIDYLEVIGLGRALAHRPLPWIAVPTTAGTGCEVTKNAVIKSEARRVKVSLRHPAMLAALAVIDPELTVSMPPAVTAATGMDALTQVLEAFVSIRANPLTDAVCREGIARAARALPRAFADGTDREARTDMALASLCGGLALANAGLGAVHGIAGPLGGMIDAPHGAICAALLAPVCKANICALRAASCDNLALSRYREVARLLTGDPTTTAENGPAWIENLVTELKVPGLAAWGLTEAMIPELVAFSRRASSMKGNPVPLDDAVLAGVIRTAL